MCAWLASEGAANLATVIGIPIAIIALFVTARQIYVGTKISRSQFWLELEKMFSKHDEVHTKLRNGGEWAMNSAGPTTAEDWVKVEDYMGLFEHCEFMLQNGLIDSKTFEQIFSYRLGNIVSNKCIVDAKLRQEKKYWQTFLKLLKRFNIQIPLN